MSNIYTVDELITALFEDVSTHGKCTCNKCITLLTIEEEYM